MVLKRKYLLTVLLVLISNLCLASEIDEDFSKLKEYENTDRYDHAQRQLSRITTILFNFDSPNYECDWEEVTVDRLNFIFDAYTKIAEHYAYSFEFAVSYGSNSASKDDNFYSYGKLLSDVLYEKNQSLNSKKFDRVSDSLDALLVLSDDKKNYSWRKSIDKYSKLRNEIIVFRNNLLARIEKDTSLRLLSIEKSCELTDTLDKAFDNYKIYDNKLCNILFDIPILHTCNLLLNCYRKELSLIKAGIARHLIPVSTPLLWITGALDSRQSDEILEKAACAFCAITVMVLPYSENDTRIRWVEASKEIKKALSEKKYEEAKGKAKILKTAFELPKKLEEVKWP